MEGQSLQQPRLDLFRTTTVRRSPAHVRESSRVPGTTGRPKQDHDSKVVRCQDSPDDGSYRGGFGDAAKPVRAISSGRQEERIRLRRDRGMLEGNGSGARGSGMVRGRLRGTLKGSAARKRTRQAEPA